MSKYNPLWEYIEKSKSECLQLTFGDLKKILGFEIDHSFLTYKKELKEFGYMVSKISLKEKFIIFNKNKERGLDLYSKSLIVLKELFARVISFSLATSKNDIPSIRGS